MEREERKDREREKERNIEKDVIYLANFIRFCLTIVQPSFLLSRLFHVKVTFFFRFIFQVHQSRSATDATARQSHVLLHKIRRGSTKTDFRRDVSNRRTAQQIVHEDPASDTLVHRSRKMLGAFIAFSNLSYFVSFCFISRFYILLQRV